MAREKFELQLVESYLVTPHVKHLVFRRSDNQPVPFIPGQFMNFHFPYNDEVCQRSYSIATRDQNSGLIEVAISEVKDGAGTQFFFTMQPGDTILADGPYGKLVLQDDPKTKRYVFIATNTGITPYRSMLNLLSTRLKNSSLKMVILLGVRTPEDLLYGQELATFAEQHENV